jgi:shikimate 5-dehydrogenase
VSPLVPADRPTLVFVGVTTGQSSIMRVFPAWAAHLGLGDVAIRGLDLPIGAEPAVYRAAVATLKDDPLVRGALVTTHKIDLFKAARDLFDEIGPHARLMEEASCLSKRDGRLVAEAKDPVSAGLALDALLPPGHFREGAALFAMGAGGSTIALTWHMTTTRPAGDRPSRIVVSDRDPHRLAEIRRIHTAIGPSMPVDYVLVAGPGANDDVLQHLPPRSVVINATGLGKDRPGSPLTDAAAFPEEAVAFDLNYRGNLVFLDQARRQQAARRLTVADGWVYFLHGWTQVIAEVFAVEIPSSGPGFEAIGAVAAAAGGR